MEGIQQGDRVEVVNAWPEGARGRVRHFTRGGKLAYVVFDKQQRSDNDDWHSFNWYSRNEIVKITTEQPAEPVVQEAEGDDRKAFLHALFPDKYATLDDAMIAGGADGVEF